MSSALVLSNPFRLAYDDEQRFCAADIESVGRSHVMFFQGVTFQYQPCHPCSAAGLMPRDRSCAIVLPARQGERVATSS